MLASGGGTTLNFRGLHAVARVLCLGVLTGVAITNGGCTSTSRTEAERPEPPQETDGPPPQGTAPVGPVGPGGNQGIRGFDEAKRELGRIYAAAGQHSDLYCGCNFVAEPGHGMRVDFTACGYVPTRDAARAERIEWEHAVPAAAFGHTFTEWTSGHPKCVDGKGKAYHGRKCARAASAEFARIEADLHNLFPVVGEVNGLRGDLPMGVLDDAAKKHAGAGTFRFGACQTAIDRGVFLPRREVRGDLARAYKYMDKSYPERHLIDEAHRAVFDSWDSEDPPDAWERDRNKRIAAKQGNLNAFIKDE